MLKITVPATSANIGSGFDCMGLALGHYNHIYMQEWYGCDITSTDGVLVPLDESNLIYSTAKRLFEICGRPFTGLKIEQVNNIPLARGMGSSSACIAGALVGANQLLGCPMTMGDLVDLAARIEGHPDNSTPALVGGFVTAVLENGRVSYSRAPVSQELMFLAVVPNFEIKTSDARRALPAMLPYGDAVFNLSRSALISCAFASGQWDKIALGVQDRIHQPYRLPLIENGAKVLDYMGNMGAYGAYISGSGSTLMAIVSRDSSAGIKAKLTQFLEQCGLAEWRVLTLEADNCGTQINNT